MRQVLLPFAAVLILFISAPPGALAAGEYIVSVNSGALQRYSESGAYRGDIIGPNNGVLGGPQHMALHDGLIFVCGYFNHQISVIDPATGEVARQFGAAGARNPAFLRMSPDGSELWVSFLESSRIVRFDPVTGNALGDLIKPGLVSKPHGVNVLPNGDFLITSDDDGIYRVTAPDRAQRIATIPMPNGRPLNTMLLRDGDTLMVTGFEPSQDLSLVAVRLSTGHIIGPVADTRGVRADGLMRGHDGAINVVYFGSGAVGRYNDAGEFLDWFIAPGGALTRANHILYLPE